MKKGLILLLLFFIGAPSFAQSRAAQNTAKTQNNEKTKEQELEQRLNRLEEKQREFDQWYSEFYLQSKERVSPFLGEKISLGGFFESALTHIAGEDMPSQTSANSHILGINLAAEFNDKIRFVTQLLSATGYSIANQHNNPAIASSPQRTYSTTVVATLVAHAYLEYRKSEAAVIQTGIGYAPFGQSFQLREFVLFKRRNGPQMLAAGDGANVGIAFPLWMGVHLSGSTSMKSGGRTGYNLYTFSPSTNPKALGLGGRLWRSNSQNVTAGVSTQYAEQTTNTFYNYGADLRLEFDKWGVVTEYAKNVISGSVPPIESYYIEPYYDLYNGEWLVYAAADYVKNRNHVIGAIANPYEIWQFAIGVNWLPIANTRFRLGYKTHDYINDTDMIGGQARDYNIVDFSAGIAF